MPFTARRVSVTDGPFTETKEALGSRYAPPSREPKHLRPSSGSSSGKVTCSGKEARSKHLRHPGPW